MGSYTFGKCRWHLDCPLKTHFTFDITLWNSIQPALNDATIVALTITNEDVALKTKSKPKRSFVFTSW